MSRFKEGERINRAINDGDTRELEWAREYSLSRARIAQTNAHENIGSPFCVASKAQVIGPAPN